MLAMKAEVKIRGIFQKKSIFPLFFGKTQNFCFNWLIWSKLCQFLIQFAFLYVIKANEKHIYDFGTLMDRNNKKSKFHQTSFEGHQKKGSNFEKFPRTYTFDYIANILIHQMYVCRTQTGKGIFEIFQLVHIKKGCWVPPVFPGRPVCCSQGSS